MQLKFHLQFQIILIVREQKIMKNEVNEDYAEI